MTAPGPCPYLACLGEPAAARGAVDEAVLAVNAKGRYFTVQKLAPLMTEGSGVVLTTSVANVKGLPMVSASAASKAALRSMTRGLARELLPRGIRVNAVSPGPIDTGILNRSLPAEAVEPTIAQMREANPMNRAEAAVTRIRPEQEPPETSYVQAGLVETQHADALRTLGDLTAARAYAQQSVDAAAHSHARGRVHRLATLAVVLAGQGDAEHASATAMQMLGHATGMESRRIHERIIAVRGAISAVSDGRASAELAERIVDMTGTHLRTR